MLDAKKACGPDLLPPFLVKKAVDFISVPLSKLYNQSMSMGTLPRDWIAANVVPVFKKGDKLLPTNYRPISLTSIVIKVMEKIICCKMTFVLEKSGCLSNSQFGNKRSTVSLFLSAVHDWCKCVVLYVASSLTSQKHLTMCPMKGYY